MASHVKVVCLCGMVPCGGGGDEEIFPWDWFSVYYHAVMYGVDFFLLILLFMVYDPFGITLSSS